MTTVNVNLPDKLKAFADEQAAAKRLAGAGEYIQSLLAREELEVALLDGLHSGTAIDGDDDWLARKRQRIIEAGQAKA